VKPVNSCGAKNRAGMPCAAAPTETGVCHLHNDPTIAAKLGQVGGRKNRRIMREAVQAMPAINTIAGIQQFIDQLVRNLLAEELPPKTAAGIAPLLNTMMRTFDPSDVERRLQHLETIEAKRKQQKSGSAD
jgi:hypothetical protein